MKHLIRTQQFTRSSLEELFDLADSLQGRREESLKGKILACLFYEPSTRTRFSFESAMMRLGGNVISAESGSENSSAAKGESIEDSTKVINYYADAIVIRHPEEGSAERAASVSGIPVINAGDGAGQHPTQALLDLYTIDRELKGVDGAHVAIVGDLKYGRAARSLAYLLGKYEDVHITFVSAPELAIGSDIKQYLKRHKVSFEETTKLEGVMKKADVIYQTRVQKERFPSAEEYQRSRGKHVITRKLADSMKKRAIIIHPLPRVGEIEAEVDASPHAVYFKQINYGLHVRMALLKLLLDTKRSKKRA